MEPTPEERKKVRKLEYNFQNDYRASLEGDNGALVREAIELARETEEKTKAKNATAIKNKLYTTLGVFFMIISGIGGMYAYIQWRQPTSITPEQIVFPIFYFDSESPIADQTFLGIRESIQKEKEQPYPEGHIKGFIVQDNSRFLAQQLGITLNSKLSATISGRGGIGIHYTDTKGYPFIILRFNGSDESYEGVSQLESSIFDMVYDFFSIPIEGPTDPLFRQSFTTVRIQNIDMRVLQKEGDPVLYLGFIDPTTLLITQNKESITEILVRLRAEYGRVVAP